MGRVGAQQTSPGMSDDGLRLNSPLGPSRPEDDDGWLSINNQGEMLVPDKGLERSLFGFSCSAGRKNNILLLSASPSSFRAISVKGSDVGSVLWAALSQLSSRMLLLGNPCCSQSPRFGVSPLTSALWP